MPVLQQYLTLYGKIKTGAWQLAPANLNWKFQLSIQILQLARLKLSIKYQCWGGSLQGCHQKNIWFNCNNDNDDNNNNNNNNNIIIIIIMVIITTTIIIIIIIIIITPFKNGGSEDKLTLKTFQTHHKVQKV